MASSARLHAPLLVLALSAACAGRQPRVGAAPDGSERGAALLSTWQPAKGQKCTIVPLPRELPAASRLLDTADLSVYLRQGGVLEHRGQVLLSLKFDSTGASTRVAVIEAEMPDAAAEAAALAARTALRQQTGAAGAARQEWGVRLRIDVDSVATFRVGRSERCEPYRVRIAAGGAGAAPPAQGLTGGRRVAKGRQSVSVLLVIGADGHVLDAALLSYPGASLSGQWSMVESPSQQQALGEHILRRLRSEQWRPGLDDRLPVAMPVTVTEQVTTEVKVRG